MYWIEWMLWYIQTSPREVEQWQEKLKKILTTKKTYKKRCKRTETLDRVSETPSAEGSIYEFNENYIELQAGESQERRGLITYISIAIICCGYKAASIALALNMIWFTGTHHSLTIPARGSHYASAVFVATLTILLFYLVAKYVRFFIRLENFSQRRMLIRFNRITRQVYLHRPKFAGGITVFDWDQVSAEAVVGEEESANIGRKLILCWGPSMPELPHLHVVFVGKRADGTSDITNLWEFIRRYMEEGPQSVPAPRKLLGKTPWPWLSVMASLSFFKPLWRAGLHWQVACIVALASPALALHALGHWISLLLCWEPRWPRIIREAGLPGKPVPPLSTAADWPPLPKARLNIKKPPARKTLKAEMQVSDQQSMTASATSVHSNTESKVKN